VTLLIANIAINSGVISILPSYIAQPLFYNGQLIALFHSSQCNEGRITSSPKNFYACVNERSALNSKVRAFITFLEQAMHSA